MFSINPRAGKPKKQVVRPAPSPSDQAQTGAPSDFRGELGQLVDTEFLFDLRDFIDHFLEALFPKELVFLFLKIFAQGRKLVCANNPAKGWKQDSVLASLVRVVHPNKLAEEFRDFAPILGILQRLVGRELQREIGQAAPGLVLLQKHVDKID